MARSTFETSYSVHEASAATGATTTNIHYWTGPARVITPEVAHPQVQRAPKQFSGKNLVEIAVLKILSDRGLGLDPWRTLQRVAHPNWWELSSNNKPESEMLVFVDGKTWRYHAGEAEGVQALVEGELVRCHDAVVINLARIKKDLQTKA